MFCSFSISFHHKFQSSELHGFSVTIQSFYSNSKNAILLSLIKLLLTFFNSEDSAFFVKGKLLKIITMILNVFFFSWCIVSSWDSHYYIIPISSSNVFTPYFLMLITINIEMSYFKDFSLEKKMSYFKDFSLEKNMRIIYRKYQEI